MDWRPKFCDDVHFLAGSRPNNHLYSQILGALVFKMIVMMLSGRGTKLFPCILRALFIGSLAFCKNRSLTARRSEDRFELQGI